MINFETPVPFVEANGARIPIIGLGTWTLRGRTCARLVDEMRIAERPTSGPYVVAMSCDQA